MDSILRDKEIIDQPIETTPPFENNQLFIGGRSVLGNTGNINIAKTTNAVRQYALNHASVSSVGTTLQTLRSFTLLAGDLGTNGMLEVKTRWSMTNNVDGKRPQLKYGGSSTTFTSGLTNEGTAEINFYIRSSNSLTTQTRSGLAFKGSGSLEVTFPADTTEDFSQNILISIQCQPDSGTVTLLGYEALHYPSISPT